MLVFAKFEHLPCSTVRTVFRRRDQPQMAIIKIIRESLRNRLDWPKLVRGHLIARKPTQPVNGLRFDSRTIDSLSNFHWRRQTGFWSFWG